mgnify:CR=1
GQAPSKYAQILICQQLKNPVNFTVGGITIIGHCPSPKQNRHVYTNKRGVSFLLLPPLPSTLVGAGFFNPNQLRGVNDMV